MKNSWEFVYILVTQISLEFDIFLFVKFVKCYLQFGYVMEFPLFCQKINNSFKTSLDTLYK